MAREIITDNSIEKIQISFDGERFALLGEIKYLSRSNSLQGVIILNPKEAKQLAEFINREAKNDRV